MIWRFPEDALQPPVYPKDGEGPLLDAGGLLHALGLGGCGLLCVADISHCRLPSEAVGRLLAVSGFVADDLSIPAVDFI